MRFAGSVKTTKYEMALFGSAGQIMPLGFTARKTKKSLWLAMVNNGPAILQHADLPPHDESEAFEWDTKRQAWVWREFSISFNSNTKAR